MQNPINPKYYNCIIEFNIQNTPKGCNDKSLNSQHLDSVPIANSIIKTGNACNITKYGYTNHKESGAPIEIYDAQFVRLNPCHLSKGIGPDTQKRFDNIMTDPAAEGKQVQASLKVKIRIGAKGILVGTDQMSNSLPGAYAYDSLW